MNKLILTSIAGLALLGLSGCATQTGTGALIGGGSGALLGGLITKDARGAGIGAVGGGLVGALAGKMMEQHDSTLASNDDRGLPYGREVSVNIVASPYTGHLVDTTGLPHGSVVRDMEVRKNFIKP